MPFEMKKQPSYLKTDQGMLLIQVMVMNISINSELDPNLPI
jgi:hypothetical protein